MSVKETKYTFNDNNQQGHYNLSEGKIAKLW